MPDYNFKEFEAGQDRGSDDPDRDTPRSRGRFTDDGDDRIFRQATDDEQGQRARRNHAPRDISGRSTASQNPGQFDEHVERTFTGIGYEAMLTSTAGWGSSVKQESGADRPNSVSTKFESNDDEDYAAFADRRDAEESLAR